MERCLEKSIQELQQVERQIAQMKKHFQMASREAAAGLEGAQKVPLPAHGSPRRPPLAWQREQLAEAAKALQEEALINELLRNKLQRLRERQKGLQEPRALGKTAAQADVAGKSVLQELVAVRLEEQLASRRHKITSWLRRFLLFLAFLQMIILLIFVLLKWDMLDGVLPPELKDAFGSCPGRSQFS